MMPAKKIFVSFFYGTHWLIDPRAQQSSGSYRFPLWSHRILFSLLELLDEHFIVILCISSCAVCIVSRGSTSVFYTLWYYLTISIVCRNVPVLYCILRRSLWALYIVFLRHHFFSYAGRQGARSPYSLSFVPSPHEV